MPKMEGGEKRRVFDFRAQPICQNVVERSPSDAASSRETVIESHASHFSRLVFN